MKIGQIMSYKTGQLYLLLTSAGSAEDRIPEDDEMTLLCLI
jgi:hypothetical protein